MVKNKNIQAGSFLRTRLFIKPDKVYAWAPAIYFCFIS